jgi:hypothetical protein
MRGVPKSPSRPDRVDRRGAVRRVEQVPAAAFQAAASDPVGDRGLLGLEQFVQVADGDVVGGRDAAGRELRVAEPLFDERPDAQQQNPLAAVG